MGRHLLSGELVELQAWLVKNDQTGIYPSPFAKPASEY